MRSLGAPVFTFLSIIYLLSFASCRREKPAVADWYEYYEAEHDARVYVGNAGGRLNVVVCVYIAEIDTKCSLRLDHDCTEEQFESLLGVLPEKGLVFKAVVSGPDTEGYPDLSQYIPFILSGDERHALWQELGLEKES